MYFSNKNCLCPTFPKPPPVTANSGWSEFKAVDWVPLTLRQRQAFLVYLGGDPWKKCGRGKERRGKGKC